MPFIITFSMSVQLLRFEEKTNTFLQQRRKKSLYQLCELQHETMMINFQIRGANFIHRSVALKNKKTVLEKSRYSRGSEEIF